MDDRAVAILTDGRVKAGRGGEMKRKSRMSRSGQSPTAPNEFVDCAGSFNTNSFVCILAA